MRVKRLVVIVLALELLLWLWIDFMVLGPGRCVWPRSSTNPSRSVKKCNYQIAGCSIAIVVVVWPAVGLCFQAKIFFSMTFVVIFVSHPPPIAHSIPAGDVPGTCQDRIF